MLFEGVRPPQRPPEAAEGRRGRLYHCAYNSAVYGPIWLKFWLQVALGRPLPPDRRKSGNLYPGNFPDFFSLFSLLWTPLDLRVDVISNWKLTLPWWPNFTLLDMYSFLLPKVPFHEMQYNLLNIAVKKEKSFQSNTGFRMLSLHGLLFLAFSCFYCLQLYLTG